MDFINWVRPAVEENSRKAPYSGLQWLVPAKSQKKGRFQQCCHIGFTAWRGCPCTYLYFGSSQRAKVEESTNNENFYFVPHRLVLACHMIFFKALSWCIDCYLCCLVCISVLYVCELWLMFVLLSVIWWLVFVGEWSRFYAIIRDKFFKLSHVFCK
jgi:hypothetical protein